MGQTPVVGAVFVRTSGYYGHVGVVSGIIDKTHFATLEMNGGQLLASPPNEYGKTTEFGVYRNHQQQTGPSMWFIYKPGTEPGAAPPTKPTPPPTKPTPPAFNPSAYVDHIVKQDNGNVASWLVISTKDGPRRNWIPNQDIYNCLKSAGHPGPDLLSAAQLDQIPDQNGIWASCQSAPTSPPPTGGGSTKDTTPPSAPTGLAQIDQSQTAVRVQWNAATDNVGVAGYDLYLNGSTVTTNATSSYVVGGLACSHSYTVEVDAYDAAGNHSGKASATVRPQDCPVAPPSPSASVSKGPAHTISTCTSSACAYMTVSWANFGSGGHTVVCYGDYGGASSFYSYSVSGSSGSSNVCVWGYRGYHVWATVDGVQTNHLTW